MCVKNETLVSVVVPVYNTDINYLKMCLTSIWGQSYKEIEVLLINDGSRNEKISEYEKLAQQDERTRLVHKENGGVSTARNRGIEEAQGKYVCFVDADDWLHPKYVQLLLGAAEKYTAPVAACRIKEVVGELEAPILDNVDFWCYEGVDIWKHINVGYCFNKLYRKDILEEIKFREGLRLCEDAMFSNQALAHGKCAYVEEELYYYRIHMNQATRMMHAKDYLDAMEVCNTVLRISYIQNDEENRCKMVAFGEEWQARRLIALCAEKVDSWYKIVDKERKDFRRKSMIYVKYGCSRFLNGMVKLSHLPTPLFVIAMRCVVSLKPLLKKLAKGY